MFYIFVKNNIKTTYFMKENSDKDDLKGLGKKHSWKKGQSGNPKGRPKKVPNLTVLHREFLAIATAVPYEFEGLETDSFSFTSISNNEKLTNFQFVMRKLFVLAQQTNKEQLAAIQLIIQLSQRCEQSLEFSLPKTI